MHGHVYAKRLIGLVSGHEILILTCERVAPNTLGMSQVSTSIYVWDCLYKNILTIFYAAYYLDLLRLYGK